MDAYETLGGTFGVHVHAEDRCNDVYMKALQEGFKQGSFPASCCSLELLKLDGYYEPMAIANLTGGVEIKYKNDGTERKIKTISQFLARLHQFLLAWLSGGLLDVTTEGTRAGAGARESRGTMSDGSMRVHFTMNDVLETEYYFFGGVDYGLEALLAAFVEFMVEVKNSVVKDKLNAASAFGEAVERTKMQTRMDKLGYTLAAGRSPKMAVVPPSPAKGGGDADQVALRGERTDHERTRKQLADSKERVKKLEEQLLVARRSGGQTNGGDHGRKRSRSPDRGRADRGHYGPGGRGRDDRR